MKVVFAPISAVEKVDSRGLAEDHKISYKVAVDQRGNNTPTENLKIG